MVDFKVSIRTTLLLVDDDRELLELSAMVLKISGFTVLTTGSPAEAISILAQQPELEVEVAILDYELPGMNGCVLADYLRARYPGLKIILHSGAGYIPQSEMGNVDGFVPKGDGVERLLEEVSACAQSSATAAVIAPESYLSATFRPV